MNTLIEKRDLRLGLILAVIGTALFSIKAIFIKLAFMQGVDATTVLALRMLIAAPLYLMVLIFMLKRLTKPIEDQKATDLLAILSIGFCGYYLAPLLDFKGLFYVSAQLERLILFTYPVMVALLSRLLLGEKITKQVWVSLILTYIGVMFLFGHEAATTHQSTPLGAGLIALAAFSFSFYVIYSGTYIKRYGSLIFTCLAMLSSSFFIMIHFSITHQISDLDVNSKVWIYAASIAVFSTLIPSFILSEAIARIGATRASITGSVGPVFTVIAAVLILGESFEIAHFFGILFVISGVLLLQLKN